MPISLEHHRIPAGSSQAGTRAPRPGPQELAGLQLFARADPSLLDKLLHDCEVRQIPAGEVLLAAGAATSDVYIILSFRAAQRSSRIPGQRGGRRARCR